jgi:hypothetical protein
VRPLPIPIKNYHFKSRNKIAFGNSTVSGSYTYFDPPTTEEKISRRAFFSYSFQEETGKTASAIDAPTTTVFGQVRKN